MYSIDKKTTRSTQGSAQSLNHLGLDSTSGEMRISSASTSEAAGPSSVIESLPEKTFVSLPTLRSISHYLRNQAQLEPERKRKEIDKLLDKIDVILNNNSASLDYSDSEQDYSFQSAKLLRGHFQNLSRLFRSADISELTYLTSRMLKTTWLEKLKKENINEAIESLAPYGEPGGTKSRTAKVSLGTGFSLSPALTATLNTEYANGLEYNADDEGLFFEMKHHIGKVAAAANIGLSADNAELSAQASASLTANGSYSTFNEFGNVKAYAETEGTNLRDPQAGFFQRLKQSIRRKFTLKADMKRLQRNEQFTANAAKRFDSLLSSLHVTDKSFTASFPEQNTPLPGYIASASGTLAAGAAIRANVFNNDVFSINANAGVGLSYANEFIDIHEYVPETAYDVTKQDPEKIKQVPEYLLRHIKHCSLTNQQEILNKLNEFHAEVASYYQVVQEYDYALKARRFSSINQRRKLRKEKHRIENKWGAIGRHQLLQMWLVSNAYIACEARKANHLNNDEITSQLEKIQAMLSDPQITYDKYLLSEIAHFQYDLKLTIAEHRIGFDVNAPLFNGNVTITKRHRVHPSIYRDGDYIDISITGALGLNASDVLNSDSISALITERAKEQGIILPNDFSFIMPDAGISGGVNCIIRYFKPRKFKTFDEGAGWRKQFTRYRGITNQHISAGASGVAAGVPVSGRVGLAYNDTQVAKEVIDPNDFIYPMIRFNRFYRNNGMNAHNKDWFNFVADHKKEFEGSFNTLATSKSRPRVELAKAFNLAYQSAKSEAEKAKIEEARAHLTASLKDYQATPDEANFDKVLKDLSTALGLLTVPWWTEHTSRWGEPLFFAGKYSGLKFGSKLKLGLGLTKRGKICFEKESSNQETGKKGKKTKF